MDNVRSRAGGVDPDALADARRVISTLMDRHSVPGLSIAVTDSSGELHSEGFGFRDLARGAVATPATRFLWFSMSKIATGAASLRAAATRAEPSSHASSLVKEVNCSSASWASSSATVG